MRHYQQMGYRVARLARENITRSAQRTRDFAVSEYGLTGDGLDVVRLIEKWGQQRAAGKIEFPDFRVVDDAELPGRAAEFRPRDLESSDDAENEHIFMFRCSAWDAAADGVPAAIETLAHEIGHCVLEHPKVTYARMYHNDRVVKEEDSEWQANLFMDELLMDRRLISEHVGWGEIQRRFLVTKTSAIRRVRALMIERLRKRQTL